jgi:hypothetical protein
MPSVPQRRGYFKYDDQDRLEKSERQIFFCIEADSKLQGRDTMKKAAFVFYVLFVILTFVGAGYVIYNGGKVNAGYAVVPMVFARICASLYRKKK